MNNRTIILSIFFSVVTFSAETMIGSETNASYYDSLDIMPRSRTPLTQIHGYRHLSTQKRLSFDINIAFNKAIRDKNLTEITDLLIMDQIDGNLINIKNKNEALHLALNYNHTYLIKSLLESGANPNVTDTESKSPLHKAAINDNAQVTEHLLRVGADSSKKDSNGFTALDIAKQYDSRKVIPILETIK